MYLYFKPKLFSKIENDKYWNYRAFYFFVDLTCFAADVSLYRVSIEIIISVIFQLSLSSLWGW